MMVESSEITFAAFEEPELVRLEHRSGADLEALQQLQYIPTSAAPVEHALDGCEGCSCKHNCSLADESESTCVCFTECSRGLHALQEQGRAAGLVRLLECGPACSCDSSCPARPTQAHVKHKLSLFWDQRKGWCVKALQEISQGSFVAEYAGEYVTGTEAERRLAQYDTEERGHALLVVRLQLPSGTSCLKCCIDATRRGNVARFINHSCDGGNLEPIIVTSRGNLLPRVALFAARDISPEEELSFSYAVSGGSTAAAAAAGAADKERGGTAVAPGASRRRCYCGAAACPGYLPSA